MNRIEKLTRHAFALVQAYFDAASQLSRDRGTPLLEALKLVVANQRAVPVVVPVPVEDPAPVVVPVPVADPAPVVVPVPVPHQTFDDPDTALAWIQSDRDASFYFQAAVMMIPANSKWANDYINENIDMGFAIGLTENEVAMVTAHECLHDVGTIATDLLVGLDEGSIAFHGLRGGYMTINTIRHGVDDAEANAPNVVADDADEENSEPNADEENAQLNVAHAAS